MIAKLRLRIKMSEHTPGPWVVDERHNLRIVGPDKKVIASIISTSKRDVNEKHGNARLIAMAPMVLWMLERVVEHLRLHNAAYLETESGREVLFFLRCAKSGKEAWDKQWIRRRS
jgi:hypothetical protein